VAERRSVMWVDEDALRRQLGKVFDRGVLTGVICTLIVLAGCAVASWVFWRGVG
jgi:hypothetical protein